jgi:hypothetical protein
MNIFETPSFCFLFFFLNLFYNFYFILFYFSSKHRQKRRRNLRGKSGFRHVGPAQVSGWPRVRCALRWDPLRGRSRAPGPYARCAPALCTGSSCAPETGCVRNKEMLLLTRMFGDRKSHRFYWDRLARLHDDCLKVVQWTVCAKKYQFFPPLKCKKSNFLKSYVKICWSHQIRSFTSSTNLALLYMPILTLWDCPSNSLNTNVWWCLLGY